MSAVPATIGYARISAPSPALETRQRHMSALRRPADDEARERPQNPLVSPVRALGLAAVKEFEIFAELVDALIVECAIELRIAGTRRYREIEAVCDEYGFMLSRTASNSRQVIEITRAPNRPIGIGYVELRARLLPVIKDDDAK